MPKYFNVSYLLVLVLICSITSTLTLLPPNDYAIFLNDVRNYEAASGVFIVQDEDSLEDSLALHNRLLNLIKKLSNLGVLSQVIGLSRIYNSDSYLNLNSNSIALYAATINTNQELENFELAVTSINNMSFGYWLLNINEKSVLDTDCQPIEELRLVFDSRVTVKCNNDDRLFRWYSLYYGHTESLLLCYWNVINGLYNFNRRYYDERYELRNATLKIGTVKLPDDLDETSIDYSKHSRLARYFADVLAELQIVMNFNVKRMQEEDEVSKWTYLLDTVASGETDLVVAPITLSKIRLEFIDFSKPLLLSKNRIYFKQPDGVSVPWTAYFRMFTTTSWSLIGLLLIGAALTTAFIKAIIDDATFLRVSMHYIMENFISIWGIYCQQGISDPPSATPLRLAYFTTLLLTLIIWAIYSASITSYLTIQSSSLPFSNIDGLVKSGSYKIIVLQNSSDQDNILAGKDPALHKLKPLLLKPHQLPTNPFAAFQQVCDDSIGFYASEAVLNDVSDNLPCPLTHIETGHFECLAMVLTKDSPYTSPLDYNLQRLDDTGILKRLKYHYFRKLDNLPDMGHAPVGLHSILPLLVIYTTGFCLSLIIFFIERICHRQRIDDIDTDDDRIIVSSAKSLPL